MRCFPRKMLNTIFYEIDEIRQEDTTIGEEPHDNTQYVDGVLKKNWKISQIIQL